MQFAAHESTDHARTLQLDELLQLAREQAARFLRGEPSDETADMEIFRRAATDGDERAWATLIERHRPMLLGETRRHAVARLVPDANDEYFVELAFERLWMAIKSQHPPRFNQLSCLVGYLKMCVASVMLDSARRHRRNRSVSIDEVELESPSDPSAAIVDRMAARTLWRAVTDELTDPSERQLAYLSLVRSLTPREICARYPTRFPDARTVYGLKRKMLERLRRSPKIRSLLNGDLAVSEQA